MSRKKTKYDKVVTQLKNLFKEEVFLKLFSFNTKTGKLENDLEKKENKIENETENKFYGDLKDERNRVMKKYPLLYGDGRRDVYIPIGWIGIWDEVSGKIEDINNEIVKLGHNPFICEQVKEKFAALRIYVSNENVPNDIYQNVINLICEYEEKSRSICEISGKENAFLCNCNGWLHTLTQESLDMIGGVKVGDPPAHLRKTYHDISSEKTS